jgi:xanthine dehydrogenase accessory factor
LEVYVEPVMPSPKVVAIGRSPAAATLVKMAAALGWRSALVDDGGDAADHPDVATVATTLSELNDLANDERTYVVVATQGHYDEDAVQAALATPAPYVGLIASARRAEAILGYLRDRGVSDAAVARVHAPAGLDLGHVTTEEIAVAVLADLVRARAAGELAGSVEAVPAERHEAVDPVCGMTVDVAGARYRTTHEGRTYYFCSAGCLERFERSPATFLAAPAG